MLVRGVCSAAIYSKSIENRNIKRGDKVAVRRSTDRLLSEFKAERSSYPSRVVKGADENCADFPRGNQDGQRNDVAIVTPPDFLLERFDLSHLRDEFDVADNDAGFFTCAGHNNNL